MNNLEQIRAANARLPGSRLRFQITVNSRYSGFAARAVPGRVLGHEVPVACLEDLVQGKLWAAADSTQRPTKRAKDRLDLARLCESHPSALSLVPAGLVPEVDEMRQKT